MSRKKLKLAKRLRAFADGAPITEAELREAARLLERPHEIPVTIILDRFARELFAELAK